MCHLIECLARGGLEPGPALRAGGGRRRVLRARAARTRARNEHHNAGRARATATALVNDCVRRRVTRRRTGTTGTRVCCGRDRRPGPGTTTARRKQRGRRGRDRTRPPRRSRNRVLTRIAAVRRKDLHATCAQQQIRRSRAAK